MAEGALELDRSRSRTLGTLQGPLEGSSGVSAGSKIELFLSFFYAFLIISWLNRVIFFAKKNEDSDPFLHDLVFT